MAPTGLCLVILLILGAMSLFHLQVFASNPVPLVKLESDILQESIVKSINRNPRVGWKASMNPRFSNYSVAQFKHLLGVKPTPLGELKSIPVKVHSESWKLPNQFDSRTAWPKCSTIGDILDQGHCGSCWAFAAVEALSDRFCIHFGKNITLSVNDLLACCGFLCGDGCDGGYPIAAWRYFKSSGVVTEECDPYFDQTGCSHPGCEPAYPTPECKKKCTAGNLLWKQSKHYSVSAYTVHSDPSNIMAEVYKNGPVEVSFTVYEMVYPVVPVDRVSSLNNYITGVLGHITHKIITIGDFAHYKSGVYKHVTGDVMGGHAVKLIGWGTTDEGEDYWLLANQWNRSWGDDGYFKIRRGTNECGIEEEVVAGLPSSKNLIKEFANIDDASLDASV